MDKNREIQMKQKVLDMLKEFMMGQEGSKFKPKSIEVEMIGKPKESLIGDDEFEGSPEDMALDAAEAAAHHMSEDEWEGSPEDREEDEAYEEEKEKNPRMSLKDFLASRSE